MSALNFQLPPIYPITDTRVSGLSHREQAEQLIAGGARIIQLRDKQATAREFYDAAKETLELTRHFRVPLIINDRVDIALAVKADGVHLGQDDLPPETARKVLGADAIVGFSTHSLKQAITAAKLPVDYVAIGPIFDTKTKENADDIVGLDALRIVREVVGKIPLVAIGGIDHRNLRQVLAAGADSAALISSLLADQAEIAARMNKMVEMAAN